MESIPALIGRIQGLRGCSPSTPPPPPDAEREASAPSLAQRLATLELVLVDDDSQDGTVELVERLARPWVKLLVRSRDRGLSQAVLAGIAQSEGEIVVVMDADLSHPPEVIPDMLRAIDRGADFVLGSRYVEGGETDDSWGLFRWLNSRLATLLARPLTQVSDPMSGFFAMPRAALDKAEDPSPLGYKIGLELLVRCRCEKVVELPIHFANRLHGESKLTVRQQLLYLRHLTRLYRFKLGW